MTAAVQPIVENSSDGSTALFTRYVDALSYIERLHRLLLDVIKDEFERLGVIDVTSVQALLLYNIGDNEVTAGELKSRGYYQGSNVSYNLKKLVEGGYISHERCAIDRRAVRIALTDKGRDIREIVNELWTRHTESFTSEGIMSPEDFATLEDSMRTLERFWTEKIRYIY